MITKSRGFGAAKVMTVEWIDLPDGPRARDVKEKVVHWSSFEEAGNEWERDSQRLG
jgi:uncharacterized protein (DUF1919 family)